MATPPHVTHAEVEAAISRILSRHQRVDDPRRSELGTEPRDVLDHLTRYSVHLPRWVAAADTQDALVLLTWLWWEDRRRERALLRRGLHLGLTATELGTPLGITSRQGLRDRLDRLDALLAFDRPDEKLTRTARRAAAEHDPRQRWINAHRQRIRSVIANLLAETVRVFGDTYVAEAPEEVANEPFDAHWLDELDADLADDHLTPATLAMLGLTLPPLRIAARQANLDPAHGLFRALRAADTLRADFARAGESPSEKATEATSDKVVENLG